MKNPLDVSFVIPAFNERENIPTLVAGCRDALEPYDGVHEIVLIDDGSTDGTGELVDGLAASDALIRPIHHPPGQNIGCHPSELEGLRVARGDAMMFLPADLQILPEVLPAFVEASASAEIVASRRAKRADPAWRRALSGLNNRVERLLVGVNVYDAHSSMLLTRRAVNELVPKIVSRSALIPAELLARAKSLGLRVTEVEIEHHPRTAGQQTGAKPSEILRVQLDLLRLKRTLRREARARRSMRKLPT
jgi:glycosyltransferase involved in cell wall biosynthesis